MSFRFVLILLDSTLDLECTALLFIKVCTYFTTHILSKICAFCRSYIKEGNTQATMGKSVSKAADIELVIGST